MPNIQSCTYVYKYLSCLAPPSHTESHCYDDGREIEQRDRVKGNIVLSSLAHDIRWYIYIFHIYVSRLFFAYNIHGWFFVKQQQWKLCSVFVTVMPILTLYSCTKYHLLTDHDRAIHKTIQINRKWNDDFEFNFDQQIERKFAQIDIYRIARW